MILAGKVNEEFAHRQFDALHFARHEVPMARHADNERRRVVGDYLILRGDHVLKDTGKQRPPKGPLWWCLQRPEGCRLS
jgi:hypothetical protein